MGEGKRGKQSGGANGGFAGLEQTQTAIPHDLRLRRTDDQRDSHSQFHPSPLVEEVQRDDPRIPVVVGKPAEPRWPAPKPLESTDSPDFSIWACVAAQLLGCWFAHRPFRWPRLQDMRGISISGIAMDKDVAMHHEGQFGTNDLIHTNSNLMLGSSMTEALRVVEGNWDSGRRRPVGMWGATSEIHIRSE